MLRISKPRRSGDSGWTSTLDVRAGGEWVRLRFYAPDGAPEARSDDALVVAALDVAKALLRALGRRDTSIADAAELHAGVRSGDADAITTVATIGAEAETDPAAAAAAAALLDAGDAAELLGRASTGDPEALDTVGQIVAAADDGDADAARAERALSAPALLDAPTLDLGTVDLGRERALTGALKRLRAALSPLPLHVRQATSTMRALAGRGAP